ncbi:hypothetical protein RFI_18628 [Reticulomyxa filosa]|uniref:Rab-GAP TBC domain-containing protein n=1 Tax=Reticulomyxa filosa TaxID=46433 RepID=X6MYC3_RETFI|nr:hypothetical protein RFI_18628 [Reticulomyxa filosa]|eukprot:ETO18633.1 hypothetical protein RFI_18628 [Reticulomyxa filosa]
MSLSPLPLPPLPPTSTTSEVINTDITLHCDGIENGSKPDQEQAQEVRQDQKQECKEKEEEKKQEKEEEKYLKQDVDENGSKFVQSHCSGGRISKTGQRGYGFRYMFTETLPGSTVALRQFDKLLQKHIPELFQHFSNNQIHVPSFACEWFITLFSYVLPLTVVFRVFDLFLVDGFKVLSFFFKNNIMYNICLNIAHLMQLEADDILMYLKQFPDSGIFLNSTDEEDGDSFIEHAMSFKITNSELHNICADLLANVVPI